jgi:hypothetical protein
MLALPVAVLRLGYGVDDGGFGVRFSAWARDLFRLIRSVQTGSGAYIASYQMGTGDFLRGGKAGRT